MPSDKRNSITTRAWFLHCSTSLRPETCLFHQPQQLQCLHHGSTKAYLCSFFSLFLPPPRRWPFVVAPIHCFLEDLITEVIAEVFTTPSFCLKRSVKCQTTPKTKRNYPVAFSLWLTDHTEAHCHVCIFRISICVVARRYTFPAFSLFITLCNGASIRKYEAYRHMNCSLINGCGNCKNNIRGHPFYWSGACEFTNIIIVTKKVNKQI